MQTSKLLFKITAATGANGLLFTLNGIPIIKKLIPASTYGAGRVKNIYAVIAQILSFVYGLCAKALYLLLMIGLPALLITQTNESDLSGLAPYCAHALFFFSCVCAMFCKGTVLADSNTRYIAVKFMRIDATKYVRATLASTYLAYVVQFIPAMLLLFLLTGGGMAEALGMLLCMLLFRLLGERMQIWIWEKTGQTILSSIKWNGPVWMLCLLAAYIPPVFGLYLPVGSIVASPVCMLVCALAAALLYRHLSFGYKGYGKLVWRTTKVTSEEDQQAAMKEATFSNVKMKDEDLRISARSGQRLQKKTGYKYFNALFFQRHRRLLFKPILIRIGIMAGVFALACIAFLIRPDLVAPVVAALPSALPVFVFVAYMTSIAARAAKAMFFNCDISMLRYAFYREPKVIVENFWIRLRYVCGYNLIINGFLSLCLVCLMGIAGVDIFSFEVLLFIMAVLLLAVFFSVHDLFLYYIFQPYTIDLDMKNPFYKLINSLIWIVAYACLQLETAGPMFVFAVLAITIAYCAIALVLIAKLSPRTFRVK